MADKNKQWILIYIKLKKLNRTQNYLIIKAIDTNRIFMIRLYLEDISCHQPGIEIKTARTTQ